jgi:putative restriction endonuclease
VELKKADDLLGLSRGDTVTKRNLAALIQFSKVPASTFWAGPASVIGNTPQQGINWVGPIPGVRAVVIKTRPGSYEADGWSDDSCSAYRYSFKAQNGVISYLEKANRVLIEQPQYGYPILLLTETPHGWLFEGRFAVTALQEKFVELSRGDIGAAAQAPPEDDLPYTEGARRYVTHLMAERSSAVVKALKATQQWTCDICGDDFLARYGVPYVEAHHKVPIATYASTYAIVPSDLALLCANCHRAVHIYMRRDGLDYDAIKAVLNAV